MVLITPLWQVQAWFSALLELVVEKFLLLPMRLDILVHVFNKMEFKSMSFCRSSHILYIAVIYYHNGALAVHIIASNSKINIKV